MLAAGLFGLTGLQIPARAAQRGHYLLGQDKGQITLLNPAGRVQWQTPSRFTAHDIWLLPDGNRLFPISAREIVEMTPGKEIVWRYESRPEPPYDGPVEVHAFQRLPGGLTMIAETGNRRIIEVNREGKIVSRTPLTIEKPHPHRDTRLVRRLESGNYLVCQEGDGVVREYAPGGETVWSYRLDLNGRPRTPGHGPEGHGTEVFGAIRKSNGNTLIACGNGNRVIEVTPRGEICWSIEQRELPGITLAWVTTLHLLDNGNLVFGNTHAGPENPQLIEVTPEKKVVWTLQDHQVFGNDLAAVHLFASPSVVAR